ncbi:hypothetical protein NYE54_02495 [Paenibacillus sp. FSL K6-1330]|uniref:hypothetical protein n=1 Tax=Paenibacillus sp. FSL K6-1330 TaxID=2975292 RepID=UPI0030DD69E9
MPNTLIHGVRSSDLLKEFTEETNKLIKGRPITAEDKDKKAALIEKQLAKQNDLQVGDKLKITSTDDTSTVEFEILGIYETSTVDGNMESAPPLFHPVPGVPKRLGTICGQRQTRGRTSKTQGRNEDDSTGRLFKSRSIS